MYMYLFGSVGITMRTAVLSLGLLGLILGLLSLGSLAGILENIVNFFNL